MASIFGSTAPGATQPVLSSAAQVGSASLLTKQGSSGHYAAGQAVEYFSSTQNAWIPAKVLIVHPNGLYTLDCKPDVPAEKIRRMPPGQTGSGPLGAAAEYKVGDQVEYFGATQGKWIPAKVVAVNSNGTWDLDCKPAVPSDKIRRPVMEPQTPSFAAEVQYREGDAVEYYGATKGKWIPAKVVKVNADGTYDLDCKPAVTSDKLRTGDAAAPASTGPLRTAASPLRSVGSLQQQTATQQAAPPPAAATGGGGGAFRAGDVVEYFSATQGTWIPAKVLVVNSNGTYSLDCKPDVPADKIRRPPPQAVGSSAGVGSMPALAAISEKGVAAFQTGDIVEYYATTLQKWIPAKVLQVNSNGTYDLDCKPAVPPEKVREPLGNHLSFLDRDSSREFRDGQVVEYFSSTQNKWIPAKVVSQAASGTYNLDCKPDVPRERIRVVPRPLGSGGVGTAPISTAQSLGANGAGGPVLFAEGDAVEYYGATRSKWIPAKVLKAHPDGTYDLDCKPGVTADKVRTPQAQYDVGDVVEYFGATQNRWIPAKVTAINQSGTYDLDCKPEVPPGRIRQRATTGGSPDLPVGDYSGTGSALRASIGSVGSTSTICSEPVQLLRATRAGDSWRYEVCPDGAAVLERQGARRIAVVAVCGAKGSGRRFLLDLLLERAQQRGGRAGPSSTKGLWLWGCMEGEDEKSPLVAFLDCEGFGDQGADAARDAQLMTLCSLLSSVLVLNSKGELNENAFDALAPICRLDVNVEERGNEAHRPTLLWVLRDSAQAGLQDDYLEKALHTASPAGQDPARRQSAREVRQSFLKFFRDRSCMALLPPTRDQAQLRQLEKLPPSALSRDFCEGVDRVRSHLLAACLSTPKGVGGQPLGCFSFVALMKQLVLAINDNRILSMKGAWETVQHTACGSLADELRKEASKLLHALAAGQAVPGGAKLPLTDEALHVVLRDQRHALKSQWDERAVGDEAVRREYWQELKEMLAREESLVRVQNARMADQQIMEALRAWQEWLDNEDDSTAPSSEEICRQLGVMMERMPVLPMARAGTAAIQAAVRRVASARGDAAEIAERHGDLHRQAVERGERAAQQEGHARSQLDQKKAELTEAVSAAQEMEQALQLVQRSVGERDDELQSVKTQIQATLGSLEACRIGEHERKARVRILQDTEASLKAELEQLQATAAKAETERLAGERYARTAHEVAQLERQRLEEQVAQAKAEAARFAKQLEEEREVLKGENERTMAEHRQKVEEVRSQLAEERRLAMGEQEKVRSEHMRKVAEARRELEEERIAYTGSLDSHKGKLLERERDTGVLEGKAQALSVESESLQHRLREIEEQIRKAEVNLERQSQENEQAQEELQAARAEVVEAKAAADARLKALADEHQQILQAEEEEAARKPKCGCSIQ